MWSLGCVAGPTLVDVDCILGYSDLKEPSGQIGSAWEWYDWIGFRKVVNRERFFFQCWIFEKSSKFWAASYKNESNLLLVRFTVCISASRNLISFTDLSIVDSPAFLERGLAEKISVCAHTTRRRIRVIFVDDFLRPMQRYHSLADPIWPDGLTTQTLSFMCQYLQNKTFVS